MKTVHLQIPNDLFQELQKLNQQVGSLEFEDFLLAILQNYVEEQNPAKKEESQEEIEKRLKDLGYM